MNELDMKVDVMENNLSLLKSQWEAVRAISGDHFRDSYDKAGIRFSTNDDLIVVFKDDVAITSLEKGFNREALYKNLIKNIQENALSVGSILNESYKKLNLPAGYGLRVDLAKDIRWIEVNQGNHLSAYVRLIGDDTDYVENQVDVEFRVFLDDKPHATLFAEKGPRFFGKSENIVRDNPFLYAETFEKLAEDIVLVFNEKIITHALAPKKETPNHYSEIILHNLVDHFGWKFTDSIGHVQKNFRNGISDGELNPHGDQFITANFNDSARYLEAYSGFNLIMDIDCRDRGTIEAAETFDSMVRDWTIEKKNAMQTTVIDPTTAEGYAKIKGNKTLEEKYQDDLDNLFLSRVVAVRNALLGIDGWDYGLKPLHSNEDIVKQNVTKADFSYAYAGSGRNVVGFSVNGIVDDLSKTPEDLAIDIEIKVQEFTPKKDRTSYGKVVEVNNNIAIQRLGRGKKEIHVLANLDGNLKQDVNAEIKYSGGRGAVIEKDTAMEIGR